ncbi:MAG TPA: hypothetical protein VK658_23010 [Chryseolinea sp.]|nr:hypothetical protein [Chryseolinea sp.]
MYPHVKYELEELERLIREESQDPGAAAARPGEDLAHRVAHEAHRIKSVFIHEVFSFSDERHLERYIQYHQQAIIRIMDHLLSFNETEPVNPEVGLKYPYQLYYNALESLLSFVEQHFTKYFDQDAKAPESYIVIAENEFRRNIRKLRQALFKKNIEPGLIDVALYTLQKVIARLPHSEITYRSVMYAKKLQKELFQFIGKVPNSADASEDLRVVLCYLNFNSIIFFNYYTAHINGLLSRVETHAERIETLSFILKKINQIQVNPGIGYRYYGSTLRSKLNDYLAEEVEHQNRIQQLAFASYSASEESVFRLFRIKLELSVAQFAYLVKVLIEIKIIQNKNVAELIRFLSRFFTTKRSEKITHESFRVRFYNVEHSTKESLKTVLMSIVNHIEKN